MEPDVHDTRYEHDGVPIAASEYTTGSDRVIFALPGITERRGSLDGLVRTLIDEVRGGSDAVVADLYAQGESGGAWNLNAMIDGFSSVVGELNERYAQTVIVGSSAGGIIGSHVSTRVPVDGLVLMSTPSGAQDFAPRWALEHPKRIPKRVISSLLTIYDRYQRLTNERYRKSSAREIDALRAANPQHLQFDGLRIGDPYAFLEGVRDAPRIDGSFARTVDTPTLFVYGGEAHLFGVRNGTLPNHLRTLVDTWGENTELIVVPGADHSLNTDTPADASFNEDPEYRWVRSLIADWISQELEH